MGCGSRASRSPRARSRFSRDFEDLVAFLATKTDKTTIARLSRVDWDTVGRVCERVVVHGLAGVAAIRHRWLIDAEPEELVGQVGVAATDPVQLFDLAVREGIHRVDNDGPDPLAGAVSQDAVDNRDPVWQRLARARTHREDVRLSLPAAVSAARWCW